MTRTHGKDGSGRLAALLDVSQALGSRSFKASLPRVLELLKDDFDAIGAEIALVGDGGSLPVEAGVGSGASVRGRYRLGEGVVGRAAKSGRTVIVPKASQEPLLIEKVPLLSDARRRRAELSLLSVPLRMDGRPAGALNLAVVYDEKRDLVEDARALEIVASMLAQAMRVHRLAEAEKERLLDENRRLKSELRGRYELANVVGNSRPMELVYEQVAQAAPATTTVLIRGESGTGKDLIAHAIHYGSARAEKPFVKVSCGALPESLIESELFGYEPGAFTDARARKKGRFELAAGGTLFLDEVGELSLATQVKLLRVLQEKEFERLGGVEPVKVDVRLLAATNRDLESAMAAGLFREDLYYRLNVFTIFVPPLRERRSDVLLLADHFVERYAEAHGKSVRRIATGAIDMLMSYHWPGNVRELENCVERAVLVCDGGVIHPHHLPPTLQTAEASGTLPRQPLKDAVTAFEKDLIRDALKIARGNRAKAARLLQTTERILLYKIGKYGVGREVDSRQSTVDSRATKS
jgi:Nif-specific regulatory protein